MREYYISALATMRAAQISNRTRPTPANGCENAPSKFRKRQNRIPWNVHVSISMFFICAQNQQQRIKNTWSPKFRKVAVTWWRLVDKSFNYSAFSKWFTRDQPVTANDSQLQRRRCYYPTPIRTIRYLPSLKLNSSISHNPFPQPLEPNSSRISSEGTWERRKFPARSVRSRPPIGFWCFLGFYTKMCTFFLVGLAIL